MTKGSTLKSLMFMKVNEKKKKRCEGKERKPVTKLPKRPTISETEGYRIITELFKTKDAKTVVKMGTAADVLGMSALALASSVGHKNAVICLLNAKANVNRQSPDGNYPLMQAVRGKFAEIAGLLLKTGAVVHLTNYEGDNAFMIAVVTGDAKIINTVWPYRKDLDINHANKYGMTALHLATERKWEGCVEFLLLNGADANSRNTHGCTALFVAVIIGDMKTTEKLVAKGTDILIEDNEGFSAICRGVETEKDEIVEFLMTKLTNTQKESYAKSRLEKLRSYIEDEFANYLERTEPFLEVLFTVFKAETFKDTLYKVKAIPNVIQFSRQYAEESDVMSTMFVLCTMLMTDFGTIVDERFTLQFIRAQGQDLVMKSLRLNPSVDKIEKANQENEVALIAGIILPLVCLCGLEEGREWLIKNLDNVQLIRVTDCLRSGTVIENFFNCQRCPPKFKKVWQSYIEFYDTVMLAKREINQADLLMDEERNRQKALKKREKKRLRRQKNKEAKEENVNKEAKEENVNKNANEKATSEIETSKAVGAEMSQSRRPEDNVRYDQHVLMPDGNVCIENVRTNDGNIIQTRRDPIQFRYNYVEPTHSKKANGYHMPQTAAPLRSKEAVTQSEWQTVEKKKVIAAKATTAKQLQVNQNAADSKKQEKRRQNKSKDQTQQTAPKQAARVVGHACWADVAKGHPQPQPQPEKQQTHQPQITQQQPHQQQTLPPFKQEYEERHHQQRRGVNTPRQDVFAYDEDFPTLKMDSDKSSVCDTDVSEVQSTSTISFCGEEQIDQVPVPLTESEIMGTIPLQQVFTDNSDVTCYPPQLIHMQQPQSGQFVPHFQMTPVPNQSLALSYGLNFQTPPPGFQVPRMMQSQIRPRVPHMPQHYGIRVNYPQGPSFPSPTVTMANIAQSLLQPYLLEHTTHEDQFQNDNGESKEECMNAHLEDWENGGTSVNQEEGFMTDASDLQEHVHSVWSSRQQSPSLTDTPDPGPEYGWNTHTQKESPSVHQHADTQTYESTDAAQLWHQENKDVVPQEMFNTSQGLQQEMVEEDFSKILTNLAKCLAISKSESVLFPETLREADGTSMGSTALSSNVPESQELFPGFHDMGSTVTVNETLNPFLLESLAKEQVKRQYRTIAGKPVLENSVYFHDFDYYASLYGLSTEELKASAAEYSQPQNIPVDDAANTGQGDELVTSQESPCYTTDADDHVLEKGRADEAADNASVNYLTLDRQEPVSTSPEVQWLPQSRRWKDKLSQIIDLPFNQRKQLGRIVLPLDTTDYRFNKSSDMVVLGFLTDGCEVAVRELDTDREVVDKELVKKLAASDTKYNFLLRYKALAEMGNIHYLAMELCDYTLEEYVTITRLDHHHDPLATNRLAWQLLKGIRYLHEDIGIVHGNLRPDNVYVDGDGKLRVGGYGFIQMDKYGQFSRRPVGNSCWQATEMFAEDDSSTPTTSADIQVVAMLLYYILTGGRHPYGSSSFEIELNLCQNSTTLTFISEEANDLLSSMLFSDVGDRPSIDACLRHPFFWSEEKRFRMVLISGSDILKEMKTGVALTGSGSITMTDFLNMSEYQSISDGWINLIDGAVLKEMRAFRQYKNTLAEMVLFIYNCCLHFDKMSYAAREVLDDPCRYFLLRFPPLFMAVYRAIKASDRTDRSCYRPFF